MNYSSLDIIEWRMHSGKANIYLAEKERGSRKWATAHMEYLQLFVLSSLYYTEPLLWNGLNYGCSSISN